VKPSAFVIEFGQRVKALRTARGLSQERLGFKAGLHRTAVSFIERAARSATLETIEKLSEALGVEPAELMPPRRKSKRG
jgi:transcriptional regulator with XRE-family HTH domain